MAKKKRSGTRYTPPASVAKAPIDEARDELFQHIMRCGVIGSLPEHQQEWFDATISYFEERYPELTKLEIVQLRTLGERFAQPLKTSKQAV